METPYKHKKKLKHGIRDPNKFQKKKGLRSMRINEF